MEQLQHEINPCSITFKKAQAEESFLATRRMGLLRASFWSSLVVTILTLVNSAYLVLSFVNGDLQVPGLRVVLIHRTSITGTILLSCLVIVLFTCERNPSCCRLHVRRLEQIASAVVFILMLAFQHLDWHYTGKLYGIPDDRFMDDDQRCYFYSSDTRLMLSWIALLISSHFFMNIRWIMLIPCEIAGVMSYIFCAILGSPEGIFNVPMNLALFCGITLLACTAKRQLERHERYSMLQLINERVRRFESDFKLEQAQSMSSNSTPARPQDLQSIVTDQTGHTGVTQLIFDVKSNCREQLKDMIKLGTQEHWLIEAKQLYFNPRELIGRGNYGVILHGKLLGMPVAVKLPLANASLSLPDLANELRFLRRVRHPHIVAFQGACILPEAEMLFLVEEVVKGTSLQDLLQNKLELNAKEKHGVLLGVARALRYLHGLRPAIAHGDLKPTNVLVLHRDKTPKLIDFGLSRIRANNSRQLGGTPRYMAPEVLTKSAQMSEADKADVFSLGRVIFFVLTETNPLHGLSVQDVVTAAEKNDVPALAWPSHFPFEDPAPQLSADCLKSTPRERLNATQVEKRLRSWLPAPTALGMEQEEDSDDGEPELRLVNCCAAAARLYLIPKNQI